MTIRAASAADEARMRDIARASKGHWGYDEERVRAWAEGLDYPPHREYWVAERDGALAAYASLEPPDALDELWVDPAFIGQGVGRLLFLHASERARALGADALRLESDPNAVGFYERMGARIVGSVVSSWGRELPLMELALA